MKYASLKREYESLFEKTSRNYFDNVIDKLLASKPSQAYSLLKKLGARPGDTEDAGAFILPNHVEQNLTPEQSADAIVDHFAAVSQEYCPIEISRLPSHVQHILSQPINVSEIPQISEFEVWEKIREVRAVKSCVPGDLPAKIAKEFSPELALPMSMIFNDIVQTGEWPEKWKIEVGIPLEKSKSAQNEAGLRIVSLTSRSS